MQLEAKKHLADALAAVDRILRFTQGKSLVDYREDDLLRAAVERQFVTIGEALVRLRDLAPDLFARVREHRRIIRFRNIVVHGYDVLAHDTVWDILQQHVPALRDASSACWGKRPSHSERIPHRHHAPRRHARLQRRDHRVDDHRVAGDGEQLLVAQRRACLAREAPQDWSHGLVKSGETTAAVRPRERLPAK